MTTSARPRRPGPSVRTRVTEHLAEGTRTHEDRLVTEEPLEIRLAAPGQPARRVWVTMRTPGHDFELAAGFAVSESLFPPSAIRQVAYCTDADLLPEEEFNVVTITLAAGTDIDAVHRHEVRSAGSSACGVCGKDSVLEVLDVVRGSAWTGDVPPPAVVRLLPERLRTGQRIFERTGGVHAAALASADGEIELVREDVGRHNAVDKVIGARVLAGESSGAACLVVSGRAGFELVQKAVTAGIGSLVAVGAPTSLSVDLARQAGLTLHGFTSPGRCVQYA
ncbi:formate dehydrogenase accessory sulfurtransferase FdhD [Nocardioides sediminis]|uniref:formate dehydrogenase accessory sulfurtransferase FdhD n=1 Tax=Nocardioides sediminis TaxID=433648 RepID=UPI000D2FCB93|nr:formate dehydrogenase accessory sulfurtransferase FdhD [Nocardioides sediminis]